MSLPKNALRLRGVFASPLPVWAHQVLDPSSELGGSHRAWVEIVVVPMAKQLGLHLPQFDQPVLNEPAVCACVLRNCWIASCPFCTGQEGIWGPDDWFYCASCGNDDVEGRLLKVHFNIEADRVTAELAKRPEPHTRGWQADETLADLVRERTDHEAEERDRQLGEGV